MPEHIINTFLCHDIESSHISQSNNNYITMMKILRYIYFIDENPEIYLFYLQNIKNNTSKQNYKARHKHQTIMILTIITCRKPRQHNNTPQQYNNRTKYNRFKHEFQRLKE